MAAGLALLGCVACGESGNFAGTIEALPDGRVRVTNPESGIWSSGGAWQLIQDLAIGAVEGTDAEVFGQIAAIQVDGAGRIYVLDRQANELRIFAPDGSHVRTVGRSGSGPGEYANANGLAWLSPDSLLVVDQRGRRYSVLTRDGDFVRSVPRSLGFFGWIASIAILDDRIYELASVRDSSGPVPAILGTWMRSATVLADQPPDAAGADEKAGRLIPHVDTLRLPMSPRPRIEPFVVRNPRAMMMMSVPFTPGPGYHVDSAGNLWHGHSSEFRLFRSTPAGDTTLEITVAATPAPVTPEEIQKWEEGTKEFKEMGGELDLSRIPKTKPYFDGLYVDPDGYLWVSVPAGANETVFAVIDPQGRYLGRLQVAGIRREAGVPPVVRNGNLYVVARDELEVPRVFRYRISGP